MTESVNSDLLNERERLLLRDMKESLGKQLTIPHSSPSKPLDEKKVRYPIGVYSFDKAIDSEINNC